MKNSTTQTFHGNGRYEYTYRVKIEARSTAVGRRWVARVEVKKSSQERNMGFSKSFANMLRKFDTSSKAFNALVAAGRSTESTDEEIAFLEAFTNMFVEAKNDEWDIALEREFGKTKDTAVHALNWGHADVAGLIIEEGHGAVDTATELLHDMVEHGAVKVGFTS